MSETESGIAYFNMLMYIIVTMLKTFITSTVFIFFVFSLIVSLPFLIDPTPIKQNDINGNILQLSYLKESLLQYGILPHWNPYINQGLPFAADPLNSYLYPSTLLFILLSPAEALKLIYFLSIFLSSISMYILAKHLKITGVLATITAMTYATSGFLASRIIAGHLEKIISYPLLPLYLYLLLKSMDKPNIMNVGFTSLILSLIIFTGDIYTTFYSLVVLLLAFLYLITENIKKIYLPIAILLLFLLFSAIKWIPILELQSEIIKVKEPYEGSQNIISIIYYLFLPLKPLFASLNLEQYITTAFGWWEKISYVGFLPFLAFIFLIAKYYKIKKPSHTLLILLLIFTFCLLSAPALFLNPYGLIIEKIPLLSYFHVPSRIFAYLSLLFLLVMGVVATHLFKSKKTIILFLSVLNLISVVAFFVFVLITKTFMEIDPNYKDVISFLKKSGNEYVAQSVSKSQIPQSEFLKSKIKVSYSNYGLQLSNSTAHQYTRFDFEDKTYQDILPKFIATSEINSIPTNAVIDHTQDFGDIKIFSINNYTPYTSISAGVVKYNQIHVNKIYVSTSADGPGTLTVIESNYPGWRAYEDGKRVEISNSRFLSVPTKAGEHSYIFEFQSRPFVIGATISLLSVSIWTLITFILYLKQNKKYFHKPQ